MSITAKPIAALASTTTAKNHASENWRRASPMASIGTFKFIPFLSCDCAAHFRRSRSSRSNLAVVAPRKTKCIDRNAKKPRSTRLPTRYRASDPDYRLRPQCLLLATDLTVAGRRSSTPVGHSMAGDHPLQPAQGMLLVQTGRS